MATVANYIVHRLRECGVDHLFGLPATSCASLFDAADAGGLETIITSGELEAGYAADGYARKRGLSAVSVSYGVGMLSMANAVAGAFVERSPMLVLNGGPTKACLENERQLGVLFQHSTGRLHTDLNIFRQISYFASRLDETRTAAETIDAAIAQAIRYQRPCYLEVDQDLWTAPLSPPKAKLYRLPREAADPASSVKRTLSLIGAAKAPAVLLGVEVERYGLQATALELLDRLGVPYATTALAKSVLPECQAGFSGVYDGDWAAKTAKTAIEEADVLLCLGVVFGIDHRKMVEKQADRMIRLYNDRIRFGRGDEKPCDLGGFLECLAQSVRCGNLVHTRTIDNHTTECDASNSSDQTTITHDLLFRIVDTILDRDVHFLMDTCLGSWLGASLRVRALSAFTSNPVWLSIGHSVGAAIGVGVATHQRTLIICGDGGLQSIPQALSTMAKLRLPVLTIVIDNGSYAIEQFLIEPGYFTGPSKRMLDYVKLNPWDYEMLARSMGFARALTVRTPAELERELAALGSWSEPTLIRVIVPSSDLPARIRASI